ncbi:MAG: hypothetical protein Unbinned2691contig1000_23 [Prokaryotic dsDNA virus sp.]|nr:MAG: hypothetical protein Unbinned2691contig1000_23 [Prokaryotic dsDNA virus sp.]|tara:strand:- start:42720 stop:43271 length:552 start_codon:yes stop_codon:yes gene_type:complete
MSESTIVFAKGRLFWPKIVGDRALVNNYEGTGKEWTLEFEPEDTSFLKEHKLLDRLKDKEDAKNPDKGPYLNLRKPELNYEGKKNDPIRIYNEDNEPWGEDKLLGNGTVADVKLKITDWGKGKKKSIWVLAVRVTDLVPYETNEFGAMDDSSEASPKKKAKAGPKPTKTSDDTPEDLEDDIPF